MADTLRVHVVVAHPTMREFLVDLLVAEYGCTVAGEPGHAADATRADLHHGDLLVIDQCAFAESAWRNAVARTGARVLVIAAENDPSWREAAAAQGADGWLAREQLGELLGREIVRAVTRPPRATTEGVT